MTTETERALKAFEWMVEEYDCNKNVTTSGLVLINTIRHALQQNEKLVEMLALILPMAKGYAHEHNVGSNQHHVNLAVQALAEYEKGE